MNELKLFRTMTETYSSHFIYCRYLLLTVFHHQRPIHNKYHFFIIIYNDTHNYSTFKTFILHTHTN